MQLFTADIIYPITSAPVPNGILALEGDNNVIGVFKDIKEMHDMLGTTPEQSSIQQLNGFICPGFINAHCHLELSHLKDQIERGTGLPGFIKGLLSKRGLFTQEQITDSIEKAGEEMRSNGIVAVGDISNTDVSFAYKNKSDIYFHTFIEILDLVPHRANEVFEEGKKLLERLGSNNIRNNAASIVPHAPYTVSENLFRLIASLSSNQPVSIHNQETLSENELFKNKSGKLFEFFSSIGNNLSHISATGKTSLQSYAPSMNKNEKTLFVHNTFTTDEDILFAKNYFKEAWWCLCPKANSFIENSLPDIKLFQKYTDNIVLGTDSYASNDTLSILEEIKALHQNHESLSIQETLNWATINGASFLGLEKHSGSFDKNKKPGINLITDVDILNQKLTTKSQVKNLV